MLKDAIVGSWTLIGCHGESAGGKRFFPYGEKPRGTLIYSTDGAMAVTLMNSERPRFALDDISLATAAEIEGAFRSFDAYSGTWQLDEALGRIQHVIEAGRIPNWVGQAHARSISLSDDVLTLTTDEFFMAGETWRVFVSWRRVLQASNALQTGG